ncbi:telomerase reverse transcriptase [Andrena cerasifolii]|uniref:telomerase reverse transcriptase n=1 Tax=Andrena cerasifolii TaxID=2819439 RepID=UPI004037A508
MENCIAESVKNAFGSEFQQYCARHKILLEQNKCGAFMAPNVNVLTECIDINERCEFKVDNRVKEIQNHRSSKVSNHKKRYCKRSSGQCKPFKNREENFCRDTTNITHRLFLANLKLQIVLYDTSPILPSSTIHSCPRDYILNTAKNGKEIYEFILKETMKDTVIVDYEVSTPFISSILETLQKRHKRFHYSSVLKHLNSKQKPDRELKFKYEVTMKQLKSFFNLILAKVVPLKMFGKLRNLKKIKKATFHLLSSPRSKSFNLSPYIEKLDITSIIWLRNVQSRKTQWLIIAKVVKWFFTGFLIKILRIQFHVTSLSTSNNERLYIARSDWYRVQKKFIKKKIHSNALQPNVEYNQWSPPIGIYKLLPKHSSVRPIFMPQYKTDVQNDLYIVFKFLKQLHITEYQSPNFQEDWKRTIQYKQNSKSEKLHFVSCDVIDAFGSIVQGQLYDIIESFCRKLPETLVLRFYAVKNERRMNFDTLCYKQYFSDPNLLLPLRPGTLYSCISHKQSQCVQKSWLLERIWRCIFSQRVQIRKKIYTVGKGLVQGTMLSPILSEIYYNFVLNKEMSVFLNSGNVIRYVDDILYGTGNEMLAKQFLQLTKTGIPQYNCRFNELKTQSNIACNGNTAMNSITYIGYKINCDTLEVEPADVTTDIRYLISFFSKQDVTPLELFRKRLCNVTRLKLTKVVLDRAINSKTTIIKILEKTCLMQAKRARILIQELFNDVHKNIKNIVKIIKLSNKKIARHVIKILLKSEEDMKESGVRAWNKKILWILWMSYKKVFKNYNILGTYFINACKS